MPPSAPSTRSQPRRLRRLLRWNRDQSNLRSAPLTINLEMSMQYLQQEDELRQGTVAKKPLLVHKDHRWLLPIVFQLQEEGHLPRPCDLMMFDAHHDACVPRCAEEIMAIRRDGITYDAIIELCRTHLDRKDDDWLVAGIELGLVKDALLFGVEDRAPGQTDHLRDYLDHVGQRHRVHILEFPREELEYQGGLSDLARRDLTTPIWDILGWDFQNGRFGFMHDRPRFLLDIDLDCFVIRWRGFRLPWPDEVFEREFEEACEDGARGWSGYRFFNELVARAGAVTIATEPYHCGGVAKADEIYQQVNKHLFDDELSLT
jgi:hypothetical protein